MSVPNQTKGLSNPVLSLQLWPVMNAKEKIREGGNMLQYIINVI